MQVAEADLKRPLLTKNCELTKKHENENLLKKQKCIKNPNLPNKPKMSK